MDHTQLHSGGTQALGSEISSGKLWEWGSYEILGKLNTKTYLSISLFLCLYLIILLYVREWKGSVDLEQKQDKVFYYIELRGKREKSLFNIKKLKEVFINCYDCYTQFRIQKRKLREELE